MKNIRIALFRNKIAFFLSAICLFIVQSATAHGLYLFAQYDGREISGKSYYSDMTPAVETYLEVYRQGETQPLLTGKTDKAGQFRLAVSGEGDFKVVIEGEEGHKVVAVADRISATTVDSNMLMLLREDIRQLKDKIYLHDILGGIGYIFGIFGAVVWFRAKRITK